MEIKVVERKRKTGRGRDKETDDWERREIKMLGKKRGQREEQRHKEIKR